MPLGELAKTTPVAAKQYYLDTSAVFALTLAEAKARGVGNIRDADVARGKKLKKFLAETQSVKALPRVTVLALEEMAAKVRSTERRATANANGHNTWPDFKQKEPQKARAADAAGPHATMLALVDVAIQQLAQYGVTFLEPVLPRVRSKRRRLCERPSRSS